MIGPVNGQMSLDEAYKFSLNKRFKYNDEQVTEVEEKVVFADNSAEGAGPYPVTYVKEEVDACLNPSTFNVTNLKVWLKRR
jgi:hypothetical protein